jgi:hypothetical protein
MTQKQLRQSRFALVGVSMAILLTAMWAGLVRMGWAIPPLQPNLTGIHGPLMVSGFLGTLIGLERAVGLGLKWTYGAPVLTALGAIALIFNLPGWIGALLITLGSAVMVAVFTYIVKHQPELHAYTMAAAAAFWVGGNLLWLFGQPISVAVAWWAGYLVLTIAGERLELSRLIFISKAARGLFVGIVAVYLAGAATVVLNYTTGWRITGLAMFALAAWLMINDIARRTIRQSGLTRFIAACMLSGYVWLGFGGLLALRYGFLVGGTYDAVLHSVFLGFVFSMIFGHAPVIFPAVLGVQMPFRLAFYLHLALLHLSLILRVGAALAEWHPGRLWGAMLNVTALLVFIGNTILAIKMVKPAAPGRRAAAGKLEPRR